MKRILTILLSLLAHAVSYSQLHDAQWVLSSVVSVVDFRNDTVQNYAITKWMNMFLTAANICDENGALLYYTDGIFIADKNGDSLLNGEGLSPCAYTDQRTGLGLAIPQGAIFLPKPGSLRYYYLIHYSNDAQGNSRPGRLYYTLIDKEGNGGLGEAIRKNVLFAVGSFREGGMTACKHANGRDWWIIMGGLGNNRLYRYLLTNDTLVSIGGQQIGPVYSPPYDVAYSSFSEDGSQYATVTYAGYVSVFDFDRCSGEFSNPQTIFNTVDTGLNPKSGGCGICISPNGRFLYVTGRINLNQYDLWATNVQDSVRIYTADSNDYAFIHFLKMAPNGKMYGSTWNGGFYFWHVIHNPDELGLACNFEYGGYTTLTANTINLPNMPNYKLGPLTGGGCDTLATGIAAINNNTQLRLQPNPANEYVYTEMPMQGNYYIELLDINGHLLQQQETKQVSIFNTEALPAGTYFLEVHSKGSNFLITTQKLIVVH